jgi:O-methyltransferase
MSILNWIKTSTMNFRHATANSFVKTIAPRLHEDFQYSRFDFDYCFRMNQLLFLCDCLDKTADIEGDFAEIGVFEGRTTVFLNKFLDSKKGNKKYYAIDTFSGFVSEDINYEVLNREKEASLYINCFKSNKKRFDKVMERNSIKRVVSVQADVNNYNLTNLKPLSFVLLDVDLYRPMKKSLKELYSALSPGGIMIVDDCDENHVSWDGSDQAYKEFMQELNKPIEIVHGKLGVVRKNR